MVSKSSSGIVLLLQAAINTDRLVGVYDLDPGSGQSPIHHRCCARVRAAAGYDTGPATSQIWPSGSAKQAVRTPQRRFIGPLINVTPRSASAAQTASTSSTGIVNWKRDPVSLPATVAGAMSSCAACVCSRLISTCSNLKTTEFLSSKYTG